MNRSSKAGDALKLLFICSRNRRRSLTAEQIFKGLPGLIVRSAGTQPSARIVVTEGLINWADVVLVMEKSHLNRLRQKYPEASARKEVVTLQIPDEFDFMQPELIHELQGRIVELLPDQGRLAHVRGRSLYECPERNEISKQLA